MRTSVKNGTADESHNDGIDHDEIELTKCLDKQDNFFLPKYERKDRKNGIKMSLRSKIVSNPKGIKLNPKRCGHLGGVFLKK